MTVQTQRHILLCVAGGTPQIITETLWALKERGERVDEIRVITTKEGQRKVKRLLLDESEGMFHRFLRDFPKVGNIKFDENRHTC
jgi:CRISPR-associated protein (TIGR02584 family)